MLARKKFGTRLSAVNRPSPLSDEMKIESHSASLGTTASASDDSVMPVNRRQPRRSTISCALRTQLAGLPAVSSMSNSICRPKMPPLAFWTLAQSSAPRFCCCPTEPSAPVKASGRPILIGPVSARAPWGRIAGEATVAAPARPTLSIARRDGRNCPDICFLPGTAVRRRPFVVRLLLCGLRGRCLDDPGLEVRRGDDLEHLEIFRAGELAMRDTGDLVDAIALADRPRALPGILERRPSVQDVDHLEGAVVDVPVLHVVLHLLAVVTNEVGDVVTLGPTLDAEIAVLEDFAQAGRPPGIGRDIVAELPVLGVGHDFSRAGHVRILFMPPCLVVESVSGARAASRLIERRQSAPRRHRSSPPSRRYARLARRRGTPRGRRIARACRPADWSGSVPASARHRRTSSAP